MESYYRILELINNNLIKGAFISLLVILVSSLAIKNKGITHSAYGTIKWMMICYAVLVIIQMVMLLSSNDNLSGQWQRATGPYWFAYWFMVLSGTVFPLLLLVKKIGNKVYLLLLISVLMNAGWLFDDIIIRVTDMHRDHTTHLPYTGELIIALQGAIIGGIAIVLGSMSLRIKRLRAENG